MREARRPGPESRRSAQPRALSNVGWSRRGLLARRAPVEAIRSNVTRALAGGDVLRRRVAAAAVPGARRGPVHQAAHAALQDLAIRRHPRGLGGPRLANELREAALDLEQRAQLLIGVMRRPVRRLLQREPILVAQDQDRVAQPAALISVEPEQLVHPDVVVDAQPIHALNPPVARDERGRQALRRSRDVDARQYADGQPAHLPLEGGVQPDGRGQDPFADGPGEVHPQVVGKALVPRIAAPVAERAHLVEHVDEREHQAGVVGAREVAVEDLEVPARRPAIGFDARGTQRVTALLRVVEREDPGHQVGHDDGGVQREHVTLRRHEHVEPRGAESLVVGVVEEILLPRPSTMFLLKLGLARMPCAAQRTMHRCDEVVARLVVVNLEDDGAVGVDHRWVGLGRRRGGLDGSVGSGARRVASRTLLRRGPQRGRRSGRRGREARRVGGRGAELGGSAGHQAGLLGGRVRA